MCIRDSHQNVDESIVKALPDFARTKIVIHPVADNMKLGGIPVFRQLVGNKVGRTVDVVKVPVKHPVKKAVNPPGKPLGLAHMKNKRHVFRLEVKGPADWDIHLFSHLQRLVIHKKRDEKMNDIGPLKGPFKGGKICFRKGKTLLMGNFRCYRKLGFTKGVWIFFFVSNGHDPYPVSYTHLDVYKRQRPNRSIHPNNGDPLHC